MSLKNSASIGISSITLSWSSYLIQKFGNETLIKEMHKYKVKLREFQHKTRLSDFAKHFKTVNKNLVDAKLLLQVRAWKSVRLKTWKIGRKTSQETSTPTFCT